MLLQGREHLGRLTPEELASELLTRQSLFREIGQRRRQLRSEVQDYARKYGVHSTELHEALQDGRLTENGEIVTWIMLHRELQDLEAG